MKINTVDFIDSRLEDIIANLRKTNSEYAIAIKRRLELSENVNNIITQDKDTLLTECDKLDFQEYLEKVFIIAALEEQEIYKQGLRDCVSILRDLRVLL